MEIYQLQYFQVLCQVKSYTKASERLMVSQPAVSIAIKKLEDEFGGNLIDRTKKSFALTPMGEALYKRAAMINAQITDIYKEMNAYSSKHRENIKVALPDNILPELTKEIALNFAPAFPDVPMIISKKDQRDIIRELENKDLDIGILCADAVEFNPKFNVREFKEVELCAVFAPDSRFSGMEKIPRETLADEQLLIAKDGGIVSDVISKYFLEASIEPKCLEYLDGDLHSPDVFMLAAEGAGVGFIDRNACKKRNFAPLDPPLKIKLVVAWAKRTVSNKTISMNKMIIDYITSL